MKRSVGVSINCRIELSHLAYFFQRLHVRDLDLLAGEFQYAFRGKVGERADGIGGGHVREIGHVFPRETNFQGHVIVLEPVSVFQHEQGFCQTSANMFLRECYCSAVRESEVNARITFMATSELLRTIPKISSVFMMQTMDSSRASADAMCISSAKKAR